MARVMNKTEKITEYIKKIVSKANSRYPNLISEEAMQQAINFYVSRSERYDVLTEEINEKINEQIKQEQRRQEMVAKNDKNSRPFSQIKNAIDKVNAILSKHRLKVYISGGAVPYLLLNTDSNRLHNDIDSVCHLSQMSMIRKTLTAEGLYIPQWDSLNNAKDGIDYGFEIRVDGVPFGVFPYTIDPDGLITQYSYNPFTTECKVKILKVQKLSDYVMSYKSKSGRIYSTVSLEYIKKTKDYSGRAKDRHDSEVIKKIGLVRNDVYERVEMYQEIQKLKGKSLRKKKERTFVVSCNDREKYEELKGETREVQQITEEDKEIAKANKKKGYVNSILVVFSVIVLGIIIATICYFLFKTK
jgi:hypothetical protein